MRFLLVNWRSLRTRISLVMLAMFLVSIWALAFYAIRTLRHDMQPMLGAQQFGTAAFVADDLNQEITERLRALEIVATRLRPTTLGNTTALQTFLESVPILEGMFSGGLLVYGSDGTVVAEVPRSAQRIGLNGMDQAYIAATLTQGKTTISPPHMGENPRAPLIVMTVPIRDAQGAVIGALAGVTNMARPNFLDQIGQGRYGKSGGYLLFAPQQRLIITATDPSRTMERQPDAGINPVIDRFVQGYEGSDLMVTPWGVEILVSAKGIPVAGWIFVVLLPTAEAFAPIRALQLRMLQATLLLTLLAAGLTGWYLKRQFQPMRSAALAMARMSESGQPLLPLSIKNDDEIGHLVDGFNRVLASPALYP